MDILTLAATFLAFVAAVNLSRASAAGPSFQRSGHRSNRRPVADADLLHFANLVLTES